MLRVYCSCPGVSATMYLRRSVEKKRYATSMVIACSRSAASPSTSNAKSSSSPCVPNLLRVPLQRRELIVVEHLRLVEQPPDERALAVVDAPARDEAQQALPFLRLQVALDVARDELRYVRHQK